MYEENVCKGKILQYSKQENMDLTRMHFINYGRIIGFIMLTRLQRKDTQVILYDFVSFSSIPPLYFNLSEPDNMSDLSCL